MAVVFVAVGDPAARSPRGSTGWRSGWRSRPASGSCCGSFYVRRLFPGAPLRARGACARRPDRRSARPRVAARSPTRRRALRRRRRARRRGCCRARCCARRSATSPGAARPRASRRRARRSRRARRHAGARSSRPKRSQRPVAGDDRLGVAPVARPMRPSWRRCSWRRAVAVAERRARGSRASCAPAAWRTTASGAVARSRPARRQRSTSSPAWVKRSSKPPSRSNSSRRIAEVARCPTSPRGDRRLLPQAPGASKRSTRVGSPSTIDAAADERVLVQAAVERVEPAGVGHAVGVEERERARRSVARAPALRAPARDRARLARPRARRARAATAAVAVARAVVDDDRRPALAERGQRRGQDARGVAGGDDHGDRCIGPALVPHHRASGRRRHPRLLRHAAGRGRRPAAPRAARQALPRRRDLRRLLGVRDGAARRGEVVAIDVLDPLRWDWPGDATPEAVDAIGGPKRSRRGVRDRARGARLERSSAATCRVYDLSPEPVGEFDVVYCGSLTLHLRDPVGALAAIRSVCRELLVYEDAIDVAADARAAPHAARGARRPRPAVVVEGQRRRRWRGGRGGGLRRRRRARPLRDAVRRGRPEPRVRPRRCTRAGREEACSPARRPPRGLCWPR